MSQFFRRRRGHCLFSPFIHPPHSYPPDRRKLTIQTFHCFRLRIFCMHEVCTQANQRATIEAFHSPTGYAMIQSPLGAYIRHESFGAVSNSFQLFVHLNDLI